MTWAAAGLVIKLEVTGLSLPLIAPVQRFEGLEKQKYPNLPYIRPTMSVTTKSANCRASELCKDTRNTRPTPHSHQAFPA